MTPGSGLFGPFVGAFHGLSRPVLPRRSGRIIEEVRRESRRKEGPNDPAGCYTSSGLILNS